LGSIGRSSIVTVIVVIAHDVQLSASHIVASGLPKLIGARRLARRSVLARHIDPPLYPGAWPPPANHVNALAKNKFHREHSARRHVLCVSYAFALEGIQHVSC